VDVNYQFGLYQPLLAQQEPHGNLDSAGHCSDKVGTVISTSGFVKAVVSQPPLAKEGNDLLLPCSCTACRAAGPWEPAVPQSSETPEPQQSKP